MKKSKPKKVVDSGWIQAPLSPKGDQERTILLPDAHDEVDDVMVKMIIFNLQAGGTMSFRGHIHIDKREIWRVHAPTRARTKRRLEMYLGDMSRNILSALYGPILVMPSR